MTTLKILAAAALLLFTSFVHSEESASPHLRTVEQFIAAFNAHDSDAMAAFVTDDVDWLSIAGESMQIEAGNKNELIASMSAYFKSCPTCQSSLAEAISTTERVSAVEIASWQGKSGHRSQRALCVYEFSGSLIRRVYYFPSEKQGDR
ncbi:MAG: nuclear transport factor 2 family protein [Lysobacter sp.]